ncbi:hypothetical protein HDU80_001020, partial [Chytriomyces hyalinus]
PAQETEAGLDGLNEKDASRFVFSGDDADAQQPALSSSSSVDQKAENGETEGDANDDGDDNDEENSDGQEEEGGEGEEEDALEVDMRLAWESLDLARVVYQKMGAAGEEKMADVLLALGDVSLEQGLWDQAIEDFSAATELKRKNLAPENRELAEAQYKLGLAYEFAKNLTISLECIHGVIATLQAKLNSLKALTGEKVTDKVKSEILDVEELVQEMHSKIDDLHLQIEESKKAAAAAEPEASSSSLGSTSTAPANVNDISGLVKSKKSAGTSSKTSPARSSAADAAATTSSASASSSAVGMKRKADGIETAADGEGIKKTRDAPDPPQMQRQYLYHRLSKDTFRPTKLTIGPWSADSQHGGPPSALMASLLRAHAGDAFRLARLSVSLYRPVPTVGVHRLTITSLNETRSTKHLSITYADAQSNKLFARAEAILLIKQDATATPATHAHLVQIEAASRVADVSNKVVPVFPDGATLRKGVTVLAPEGKLSKFMHVMQAVFSVGRAWFGAADERLLDANRQSPCEWYVRSSAGVGVWVDETVQGSGSNVGETRDLDLLESAIMFGDASSGASGVLKWGEFMYSNIDYTVNFLRDPEPLTLNASTKDTDQEWVCFRSRTRINPAGSGVTVSDVYDRSGPFATTTQNLVVRKMENVVLTDLDLDITPSMTMSYPSPGGPPSALMACLMREHAGDAFRLARMSVTLYRPIPATGAHQLRIACLSETRSTKHLAVTYADAVSNRIYARAEAILLARTDAAATPATRAHLEHIDATTRAADAKQRGVLPEFPSAAALRKQLGSQSNAPLSTFMQAMQTVFEPTREMYGSKTHDCVNANRESASQWYARPAARVGFWPGRELDAVDRAVMFGDMSSGASAVLEYGIFERGLYRQFLRDPEPDTIGMDEQEWVCFRSRTRINPGGTGVTASEVFDRRGIFAATLQNLITRKLDSKL